MADIQTIGISPGSVDLPQGTIQQFQATAYDANLHPLVPQPAFTWTWVGVGTLSSGGLYVPTSDLGDATVKAEAAGVSKTSSVTVERIAYAPGIVFQSGLVRVVAEGYNNY